MGTIIELLSKIPDPSGDSIVSSILRDDAFAEYSWKYYHEMII